MAKRRAIPAAGVEVELSLEEQTEVLDQVIDEFAFFLEKYVYILDSQKMKRLKWHSWSCHRRFLEALDKEQLVIVLKARQLGISWVLAARALWLAGFHIGARISIFSQGQHEAAALLRRVKYIYANLPPFMQARLDKDNETTMTFPELDSEIDAFPATGDAGRSESATLVICDEWASHPFPAEQYAAVKPIIDAGGKMVGVSTGKDAGSFFHALWQGANTGENNFRPLFFSWRERPDRDDAWYEKQAREYPAALLHREYPANPMEAFSQSGAPYFSAEYLTLRALKTEPIHFDRLPPDLKLDTHLMVYQLPRPGRRYCLGVDVADSEGVLVKDTARDYSCCRVLDWEANEEVAMLHGRWDTGRLAELVDALARAYPGIVGIERNGLGVAVIKKCEELGTPGLYRETQILRKLGEAPKFGKHGWVTDSGSKPVMLRELEEALRLGYHRVASQRFLDEALVFQDFGGNKAGAAPGFHDDCVMAGAIAVQMRKHLRATSADGERVRVTKRGPVFSMVG